MPLTAQCHPRDGRTIMQHSRASDHVNHFSHRQGFRILAPDTGACQNCGYVIDPAANAAYLTLCRAQGFVPQVPKD
jgi:hypothetical protein